MISRYMWLGKKKKKNFDKIQYIATAKGQRPGVYEGLPFLRPIKTIGLFMCPNVQI